MCVPFYTLIGKPLDAPCAMFQLIPRCTRHSTRSAKGAQVALQARRLWINQGNSNGEFRRITGAISHQLCRDGRATGDSASRSSRCHPLALEVVPVRVLDAEINRPNCVELASN